MKFTESEIYTNLIKEWKMSQVISEMRDCLVWYRPLRNPHVMTLEVIFFLISYYCFSFSHNFIIDLGWHTYRGGLESFVRGFLFSRLMKWKSWVSSTSKESDVELGFNQFHHFQKVLFGVVGWLVGVSRLSVGDLCHWKL